MDIKNLLLIAQCLALQLFDLFGELRIFLLENFALRFQTQHLFQFDVEFMFLLFFLFYCFLINTNNRKDRKKKGIMQKFFISLFKPFVLRLFLEEIRFLRIIVGFDFSVVSPIP